MATRAMSSTPDEQAKTTEPAAPMSRAAKTLWRLLGWALFAIGLVGLVTPVLPTVGFWILAVLVLQRADPALARRIRNHPKVGPSVSLFLDHGVIAPRGKLAALTAMGASAALLAALLTPGVALFLALGGIAVGALFVATRPTRPPAPDGAGQERQQERELNDGRDEPAPHNPVPTPPGSERG